MLILQSVSVLFLILAAFILFEFMPGHKTLNSLLIQKLNKSRHLPSRDISTPDKTDTVIYVMGGSEYSLKKKFITVSGLYKQNLAGKILVLSVPGITRYEYELGRNLTHDEWAIKNLAALGVNKMDIEPISVENGRFGTLSEAATVSGIILERGYSNLILVTSGFHTQRVWLSFSAFLKNEDINVYIYGADENTNLSGLLAEYLKLLIYEYYLLNNIQN